jgi:methionine-rich copper-binding protein CopC
MPTRSPHPHRRYLAGVLVATGLMVMLPPTVGAHSELLSSDPAGGATVSSPFSGPIVLTFSEHLAEGSKADLVAADGSSVASATVDATAPTMTLTLASPLAPGAYQVKWTSIADDGDLLRGTLTFSVAASTASPTAVASTSAEPSAAATNPPSAAATAGAATSSASPASPGATGTGGAGADVILPIVIALIVAAAGGFYLVRRNRPA